MQLTVVALQFNMPGIYLRSGTKVRCPTDQYSITDYGEGTS